MLSFFARSARCSGAPSPSSNSFPPGRRSSYLEDLARLVVRLQIPVPAVSNDDLSGSETPQPPPEIAREIPPEPRPVEENPSVIQHVQEKQTSAANFRARFEDRRQGRMDAFFREQPQTFRQRLLYRASRPFALRDIFGTPALRQYSSPSLHVESETRARSRASLRSGGCAG